MHILTRKTGAKRWEARESDEMKVERDLQKMLEDSPSLIRIQDMREGASPLVVSIPEFQLPGSGSIDILAFSSKGDVAVIECKLDKNPEARRKVVGQVLEYASFLCEKGYDEIDAEVRRITKKPLAELVRQATEGEWDEEGFKQGVTDSLQGGGFLLMVVVDGINEQLRHIVRYVNEFSKSEFSLHVLEMKVFKAEGVEIVVPQLHGESAKPSASRVRRKWSEDDFFQDMTSRCPEGVDVARGLYEWSVDNADETSFGVGGQFGTFTFSYLGENVRHSVFAIWTNGHLVMNYDYLARYINKEIVGAFKEKIREIRPMRNLSGGSAFPYAKIETLAGDNYLKDFEEALLWLRTQLRT